MVLQHLQHAVAIGALAVAASACGVEDPPRPLAQPDFDYFVCGVHPKLQAGCAMSACHGGSRVSLEHGTAAAEQMILRVHSPGLLRLPPPDGGTYTSSYRAASPLTREELTIDYNALRALIDQAEPLESAPLRKPLAASAGGGWHGGGVIFQNAQDPTYEALTRWVSGADSTSLSPQDQQACEIILQRSLSL